MSAAIPSFGTTTYPTPVPSTSQVVIPQITIPQPMTQYTQPAQPIQQSIPGPQLYSVKGMDGAKQFQTVANARYALFDEDDDVFYLKETDNNNYPSIRRFRFVEEAEPEPEAPPEYITKEDFAALVAEVKSMREEMHNAEQHIWQSGSDGPATTKSSSKRTASTSST